MDPRQVLWVFIGLRVAQLVFERGLARANRSYWRDPARQERARTLLSMSHDDMHKTLAYAEDRYRFSGVSEWLSMIVLLSFLALGGLGICEAWAQRWASAVDGGELVTGLFFFAILGILSMALSAPLDWYRTFVIEQAHGFNRQTQRGFWLDRIKGVLLGGILGGLILAAILAIMLAAGSWWWIYAWLAMSGFSLLTAWLYPTFLAPLFNKFTPLPAGELKDRIDHLAARVGFQAAGVFLMNASLRSSHGNAYFTGVFGKKRIVLFDTLVEKLSPAEVEAVLAHELGHFKLRHIRWALLRGIGMTGLMFWLLSLALPYDLPYRAFGLSGVSSYGALIVFSLWFGLADFLLQPLGNLISRRNEFAADRYAGDQLGDATQLATALLKLRESSQAMPIVHPMYSNVYHSHPPLLERLEAMGYAANARV